MGTSVVSTALRLQVPPRADGGTNSRPEIAQARIATSPPSDDFSREVYCVLGMPVDAIEMPAVLRSIETAAATLRSFLISTPNLNFLVNYKRDAEFRNSLLLSDLCPVDGMLLVWIARLIGIPIKTRIAGSDIFESLKTGTRSGSRLKVFLFGGGSGVAAAASRALNVNSAGLRCVGWDYPGFGTVDEMSRDDIIEKINASDADFLVASLGAKKGQAWLQRNHDRLGIPIRAHLGAVLNFEAGTIERAPAWMRNLGLEWLWRIKEEPYLWRRYVYDGCVLLHLLVTRAMPLAIETWWQRLMSRHSGRGLLIRRHHDGDRIVLNLAGDAIASHVEKATAWFRDAVTMQKQIVVNFSGTRVVDARFLGLLLMLKKRLNEQGTEPKFVGLSPRLMRIFRFHGLEFLLSTG